jgi:hypothetical protein
MLHTGLSPSLPFLEEKTISASNVRFGPCVPHGMDLARAMYLDTTGRSSLVELRAGLDSEKRT